MTVLMGQMGQMGLLVLYLALCLQKVQYIGHCQDSGGNWKHLIPVEHC